MSIVCDLIVIFIMWQVVLMLYSSKNTAKIITPECVITTPPECVNITRFESLLSAWDHLATDGELPLATVEEVELFINDIFTLRHFLDDREKCTAVVLRDLTWIKLICGPKETVKNIRMTYRHQFPLAAKQLLQRYRNNHL